VVCGHRSGLLREVSGYGVWRHGTHFDYPLGKIPKHGKRHFELKRKKKREQRGKDKSPLIGFRDVQVNEGFRMGNVFGPKRNRIFYRRIG